MKIEHKITTKNNNTTTSEHPVMFFLRDVLDGLLDVTNIDVGRKLQRSD